jgi:hypothetical protein
MKMISNYLVLIVTSLILACSAHAQKAFDGVNLQLGLGLANSQINASGAQDNSWGGSLGGELGLNGKSTANRVNGLASIGYSKSIDSYNLAANLFYVIGSQSAGGKTAGDSNTIFTPDGSQYSVSESLSSTYKLKNTWGITLEPGYYFGEQTLGYLKLAYVRTTLQTNLFCNASDAYCNNAMVTNQQGLNGFGYGIGVKQQLTENIFASVDLLGISYGSVNQSYNWFPSVAYQNNAAFKANQYMGFISVGYKF